MGFVNEIKQQQCAEVKATNQDWSSFGDYVDKSSERPYNAIVAVTTIPNLLLNPGRGRRIHCWNMDGEIVD